MTADIRPPESADEDPRLYPPLRLGGFRTVRVRRGGFALVYLGYLNDEPVAVKLLRRELNVAPDLAQNFYRECNYWLRLGTHPHIARALRAWRMRDEPPFVIVEYFPDSLRDVLCRIHRTDMRSIMSIMREVVSALAYAGSAIPGFVHGDLKPENILLDEEGHAHVTDFGLSHALRRSFDSEPSGREVVGGTAYYLAPEMVRTGEVSAATDVYALGCIMYEMATGNLLYGPVSPDLYPILHLEALPPVLFCGYGSPKELNAVGGLIEDCLSKDPHGRPDYNALLLALGHTNTEGGQASGRAGPAGRSESLDNFWSLVDLGFDDDALACGAKILSASPEAAVSAHVHLGLARVLLRRDRHIAEDHLARADELISSVELSAQHDLRITSLGVHADLAGLSGDMVENLRLSHMVVELEPGHSSSWANRAYAYAYNRNYEAAFDDICHALDIATNLDYYVLAVELALILRRMDDALRFSEECVERHPYSGDAYIMRSFTSLCQLKPGDNPRRALADYDRGVEMDSHHRLLEGLHDMVAVLRRDH